MEGDVSVILEIENTPLICNRQQLVDNSDYFKVMFEGNFIESQKKTIKLQDVHLTPMKIVLQLLSDNEFMIRQEDLFSVLQTVSMLQFLSLKSIIIKRLVESLDPDICLKTWIVCEQLEIRPLYLCAKTMSLMEFSYIKDKDCITEITQAHLCAYLGNKNLRYHSELEVFQAAMRWWQHNRSSYEKQDVQEQLTNFIHCIDFNRMTVDEIKEMKIYPEVADCPVIVQILDCIISTKKKQRRCGRLNAAIITRAEKLLTCEGRTRLECPCVLVDYWPNADFNKASRPRRSSAPWGSTQTIMYFDLESGKVERLTELSQYKSCKLEGFAIIAYKQYVLTFGGEYLIGRGEWNTDFWVYDTMKERLHRKSVMPYLRRHFECCICKDIVYIIGGTEKYRIAKDTMVTYNFKTDEWSREIPLPCKGLQIKCFNYKENVCLLSISDRCLYMYNPSCEDWEQIVFRDLTEIEPMFSEGLAAFSYKDSICLKGTKFIELKIKNGKMEFVVNRSLDIAAFDDIKSVVAGNFVYTVYKRFDINRSDFTISFEKFDLETYDISPLWANLSQSKFTMIGGDAFLYSDWLSLFTLHHYSINETTELVTSM